MITSGNETKELGLVDRAAESGPGSARGAGKVEEGYRVGGDGVRQ